MDDLLTLSVRDFLEATAARRPAPGGGAATALVGGLAAALAAMALEYTVGKKAFAGEDRAIREALGAFQSAGRLFQELIAEDAAAYEALGPLLKVPEEARRRDPDYGAAVVAAIRAPQATAALAANVLERCGGLLDKTNPRLLSDLGVAAALAHAAVHAAELNVRINLPLLADAAEAAGLKESLLELARKADDQYAIIHTFMRATL